MCLLGNNVAQIQFKTALNVHELPRNLMRAALLCVCVRVLLIQPGGSVSTR